MAKQLDAEAIIDQLAGLEQKIAGDTIRDIIATLQEFTAAGVEYAGMVAAVEVIKANYNTK